MSQNILDDASWEETTWEEEPRGPRRWPFVLLGVLLLCGAAYAAAAAVLGDRVPRSTTVAGVQVGGLSADEARTTLTKALSGAERRHLVLTSSAGQARFTPSALGASVDVPGTVDRLTGFSLSPARMWQHLAGGGEQPAEVAVDVPTFTAAVEKVRSALDAPATEGGLSVATGTVAYTAPKPGSTLDVAGTLDAVRRWWPRQGTVEVAAEPIAPKVSAAELERVREQVADVVVSGPVTVKANGKTFSLTPAQLGPAVTFVPAADGTLDAKPDDAKLLAVVGAAATAAGAEVPAKDAVVTFRNITPTVTPHVAGVGLDPTSARTHVWEALTSTQRTAEVRTVGTEPAFTSAKAQATLPTGVISTFTTQFPCCQARVHNIQRGGAVVDGTYVLPGQQFSLNAVLGDTTTKESGYVEAGIIRYGRAAKSYGGGLSQVSTTVFNAAFFSGMQLDAWTPHAYYISRYPEGREATISWPNLHHKWTNTTDGGVLIKVRTTGTSITVTFYGRKKYDVSATKSARYAITKPKKIVDDSPDCIPQAPVDGFTVDVGRIIKQGATVVKRETFTTRYQPEDDVTCTAAKP